METQSFDTVLAAAYVRGEALRQAQAGGEAAPVRLPAPLLETPLAQLTGEQRQAILAVGKAAGLALYRFKKTHDELPRVRRVLGYLHGLGMETLLDVGSGRGVFLWPCLATFPGLAVTSVDRLAHRVAFLQSVTRGGLANLTALEGDACALPFADQAFDVVTLLEVLEHIPDVAAAVREAVRVSRGQVLVSVPSQPDDNPEHIHLLTRERLTALFGEAGCTRLHFEGVPGHLILFASREVQP